MKRYFNKPIVSIDYIADDIVTTSLGLHDEEGNLIPLTPDRRESIWE